MNSGFKKTIAFIFFLLAGVITGSLIAHICSGSPYLSWLAFEKTVGLSTSSPLILDLVVFKLAFGFTFTANVAQIICVILSFILYNKTCKGL